MVKHLVLHVTLDGRPIEGIPDLEPLEHSVLGMALHSGLMEGISQLEPLEHSVPDAALNSRPIEEAPVLHSSQCSVLQMVWRKGSWRRMVDRRLVQTAI